MSMGITNASGAVFKCCQQSGSLKIVHSWCVPLECCYSTVQESFTEAERTQSRKKWPATRTYHLERPSISSMPPSNEAIQGLPNHTCLRSPAVNYTAGECNKVAGGKTRGVMRDAEIKANVSVLCFAHICAKEGLEYKTLVFF